MGDTLNFAALNINFSAIKNIFWQYFFTVQFTVIYCSLHNTGVVYYTSLLHIFDSTTLFGQLSVHVHGHPLGWSAIIPVFCIC